MCARHQKDQLLGGRKKEAGMTNWQSKEATSGEKESFTKWKELRPGGEGEGHGVRQGRYRLESERAEGIGGAPCKGFERRPV